MLHKYCPSCASLDIRIVGNGIEECGKCRHRGDFREGAMDEINSFKKSLGRGIPDAQPGQGKQSAREGLKARLNPLKGKKTDDFEIL